MENHKPISDELLLSMYHKAVALKLDQEFLQLLLEEIVARGLTVNED